MEKLPGHITYMAMLYRPLLALLNCCYAFVRNKYVQPVRVWFSVAQELLHCRCLLLLARVNLRLPIETIVLSSDASLSGLSVCSTLGTILMLPPLLFGQSDTDSKCFRIRIYREHGVERSQTQMSSSRRGSLNSLTRQVLWRRRGMQMF